MVRIFQITLCHMIILKHCRVSINSPVANGGGGKYMFDQGQFNQSVGTDWFRLKEYLTAKLQWNVNQDMDTLIDNFFTNYFKNASVSMKNFFDSQQLHHTWLAEEKRHYRLCF